MTSNPQPTVHKHGENKMPITLRKYQSLYPPVPLQRQRAEPLKIECRTPALRDTQFEYHSTGL